MTPYLDHTEPMFSITHSRRPLPDHLAVQYRQLVSGAVTRQLFNPSIDDECAHVDKNHDIFAAWEINDHKVARRSVGKEVRRLGIPWDTFRLDVERAQREPHVLGPAYYEDGQESENGDTTTKKATSRDGYEKLGRCSHTGETQDEVLTTGTDARKMLLESQMLNLRHFSKLRK